MTYIEVLFSPIVLALQLYITFCETILNSAGVSLVVAGMTFTALTTPIRRKFEKYESDLIIKIGNVKSDVAKLNPDLAGERRFFAIEKIYESHGYHPIQNIWLGGSFLVTMPFLIASIFLFSDETFLEGQSFWLLKNLAAQDNLIFGINFLPVLMLFITLADVKLSMSYDKSTKLKFTIIAIAIFILVYPLDAGLILYWIGALSFPLAIKLYHSVKI